MLKFRDKEKHLMVDVFTKTAEYVVSIIVFGTVISGKFHLWLFLAGIIAFISLTCIALYISSKTKEKEDKEVSQNERCY